jgi:hypothetical protein
MIKRIIQLIRFMIAYFRIPTGDYCHSTDGKGKVCPYWRIDNDREYQYNGYCVYLGKGDWELHQDETFTWQYPEAIKGTTVKGKDVGFPISLLWDQCKECNIKLKI